MAASRILVRSAAGPYAVACGPAVLRRAAAEIRALGPHTGLYLLSSPRVARHWGAQLESLLRPAGLRATILFDDRETSKTLKTVERICRRLVRAGADRRSLLVALGGGVVGDVCGFVAASYLRGVSLVHVPTTLVAQVDSAIGGKTGVNLPEGKNLVGAFYSPRLVLADPRMLSTLPARQYRSGLYEVVKYGVIGDRALFAELENRIEQLLRRNSSALDFTIVRCARAKASVVTRDERESGLREVLNFGHTFAHAFETATGYRRYLHGEAVGWGMIAAARLAESMGAIEARQARRVESLVRRIGPLPSLPPVAASRLVNLMRADKKTRGGRLRFVLPDRIGRVRTVSGVPELAVERILAALRRENARAR